MAGKIVNAAELRSHLDLSQATVQEWQREGMPFLQEAQRGKNGWQFDLGAVVRWREKRAREEARAKLHGVIDKDDPKARKTNAEAQLAELNYALKTGKAVPIDFVCEQLGKQIAGLRAKLLGLPSVLAPTLAISDTAGECLQVLERGIREALEELHGQLSRSPVSDDATGDQEFPSGTLPNMEAFSASPEAQDLGMG